MINKEEKMVEQMCFAVLKLINKLLNPETFGKGSSEDLTQSYFKKMDVNGVL